MEKINIANYGLRVGSKLPLSLYDNKGKLLYRQGTEITAANQIERLKRIDLYGIVERSSKPRIHTNPDKNKSEEIHPFAQLASVELKLKNIMNGVEEGKSTTKENLERLASEIFQIINRFPDIALGYCHWPYNDRTGLHQPIICSVLAASAAVAIEFDESKIIALISGSLMQNVASWDYQLQLNRQASGLSEEQKERLLRHPVESAELLMKVGIEQPDILDTVKYHHERPDGSGYPFALTGNDIPSLAKLVGIADSYVAMTTERAYRALVPSKIALREIFLMNKDPEAGLYGSFIKSMGIYPPGTFVLLSNGETAVVTARNKESSIKPFVKSVVSPKGTRYPKPLKRSLADLGLEVFRALTMSEIVSANWYELWDLEND